MCLPLGISGGFGHKISGKDKRAVSFTEEFPPEVFSRHRMLWLVLPRKHR